MVAALVVATGIVFPVLILWLVALPRVTPGVKPPVVNATSLSSSVFSSGECYYGRVNRPHLQRHWRPVRASRLDPFSTLF